jgi:hypothetical protein
VSGWETMKGLVPHWKPTSPSPLSSAASSGLSSGEGGDPAFGDSGESNGGSAGSYVDVCAVLALACAVSSHPQGALVLTWNFCLHSTPTKMRKATPRKGARKGRDRQVRISKRCHAALLQRFVRVQTERHQMMSLTILSDCFPPPPRRTRCWRARVTRIHMTNYVRHRRRRKLHRSSVLIHHGRGICRSFHSSRLRARTEEASRPSARSLGCHKWQR